MEQKDEELMLDYQTGNEGAIEVIFTRYKNRILNFCMRMLGNRADAEDATADTFLALFSKKYRFTPTAKFSTWLFTVARNSCINRIRKRNKMTSLWFHSKQSGTYEQWDVEDSTDSSREDLEKKEAARHVQEAIGVLPYQQREALVLREYHQFNYEQIAQILNCSLENVKILIFRARERLRVELASFVKGEE